VDGARLRHYCGHLVAATPARVMILTGVLSNPEFGLLIQSLTSHERHKPRRARKVQPAGNPDGRRKFGSVGGAIVQVLMEAQSDLRVKEIRASVDHD